MVSEFWTQCAHKCLLAVINEQRLDLVWATAEKYLTIYSKIRV